METLRHAVSEATVAVDDPEGFWTQGTDLSRTDLADLNDQISRGRASILAVRPNGRWLITLGQGQTYMVLPIERCVGCGQTVDIYEMPETYEPVHSFCFDPAEWDWRG